MLKGLGGLGDMAKMMKAAQEAQAKMGELQQDLARIVVVGDSDFLSNTYLGNGANLEWGLNSLNWLSIDAVPMLIPPRTTPTNRRTPRPSAHPGGHRHSERTCPGSSSSTPPRPG